MNEENHDDSTRVRHVPIHIESREPNSSNTSSRSSASTRRVNSGYNPNNDHHHQQQQHHHHNQREEFMDHQTFPNTSSININYKPPPPARGHNHHQQVNANRAYCQEEHQLGSSGGNYHQESRQHQAFNNKNDRSSNTSPTSSDSKLVNSPEPIPLPPPSEQQHYSSSTTANSSDSNKHSNNSSSHDQQQQQSPSTATNTTNTTQERDQDANKKDISLSGLINSIKLEVTDLLKKITAFDGISAKSKDYRYLDEMLTRCMLNLDNIQCGDSSELRQQRRAAIKLVDQATDILQRKLQINSDIHDLSESMSASSS